MFFDLLKQRNQDKIKSSDELIMDRYEQKRERYCYVDCECKSVQQYEASITRLYHTVEKGLSYLEYRPGFGKDQIEKLIITLDQYSGQYDTNTFFYRTALCCLYEYVKKNREYGYEDKELEDKIACLPGEANIHGGSISFTPMNLEEASLAPFDRIMKSRHSIRHFSSEPVDISNVKQAISLAQYTPSACNRQGWKTRIICDKGRMKKVLENQNGNRGFGDEIDKLLVITADLRYFQKNREVFQAFIDGGMYAESILNSLYFYNIASVPLSASLTNEQEKNVRSILGMDSAEVLILFIGIGNYPDICITTKSARKPAECIEIEVL